MSAGLKHCPFCGGEAEYRNDPTTGFVCATCTSLQCGTIPRTPWYSTKTKAAEAWNTRPATTIGQIAVDVVSSGVVRCRDCKHATMTVHDEAKYCAKWVLPDEDGYGANPQVYLPGDFFCAWGVRRASDD